METPSRNRTSDKQPALPTAFVTLPTAGGQPSHVELLSPCLCRSFDRRDTLENLGAGGHSGPILLAPFKSSIF
jgi:hypothetical protein